MTWNNILYEVKRLIFNVRSRKMQTKMPTVRKQMNLTCNLLDVPIKPIHSNGIPL